MAVCALLFMVSSSSFSSNAEVEAAGSVQDGVLHYDEVRLSVLSTTSESCSDMKTIFVTVGTTCFDELISSITSSDAVQALKAHGYERLVLQVGRGSVLPTPETCPDVQLEAFRFKDSIAEDIKCADLVISHAGAGSCLEALGAGKPLLVVVNDGLMDNHQMELARQLHKDSHLLYCTCSTLTATMNTMDLSVLQPFVPGQPKYFANFLDRALGVQ